VKEHELKAHNQDIIRGKLP